MNKLLGVLEVKSYSLKRRLRRLVEEEDGVWRTIQGRAIFIRKGESAEEAFKRDELYRRVGKERRKRRKGWDKGPGALRIRGERGGK